MRTLTGSILAAGVLAVLTACGGSDSPTSPSPGGGGGGAATSGATITIGSNGAVSPAQVTISTGQTVTFVNNDSRAHDMASNPHPAHTDCPAIGAVGNIAPGQTKVTNAFTTARTCGFHDHNNPESASLQGNIVIQ
jgi:plastocyanin